MDKAITIAVDDKALFKSKLVGDLRDSVQHCTESLDEIERQRHKLIKAMWPGFDWLEHALDYVWECKESPAGWCVYHRWDDRAHDHCLFCGDPSERK